MYQSISACRICGNRNLIVVLQLGEQALTGVFPKRKDDPITKGPLTLVKCCGDGVCGLLQLAHSYSLSEMYGENYGYRSGLNPSMVAHLKSKVARIKSFDLIQSNDIIVDIGSNDATTLKLYDRPDCQLVGIDPTGAKFRGYYTSNVRLIPDFFSSTNFHAAFPGRKARVVTSFSMFYDLEDPIEFMRQVAQIMEDDGIWVFEQSYMPSMLKTNSYDTVCHEHLEYYALAQIMWMAEKVGLKIVDVEINDVNGGSFSVVAQKTTGTLRPTSAVGSLLEEERRSGLDDLATYLAFGQRVEESRIGLLAFLRRAKSEGRRVVALGASTKGNVLLQYCGVDSSLIDAVGEINPDKFGSYTPGTLINIVDETTLLASKPDYVLVLPWHFRSFFQSQVRYKELHLVYPLPELSIG